MLLHSWISINDNKKGSNDIFLTRKIWILSFGLDETKVFYHNFIIEVFEVLLNIKIKGWIYF